MKNPCYLIARCLALRAGSVKRFTGALVFSFLVASSLQAASYASLYQAGVQALDAGQYAKARQLLAQAITEDPDQPGAWLDLAIAALAEGDNAFADDILQMMTQRFGVPEHLTALVERLRRDLDRSLSGYDPTAQDWDMRSRFSVALGHDSNANGGLSIAALALTFPEGAFSLPIDPALQRRSDQFLASNLSFLASSRFANGTLEPGLRIRVRENFSANDFSTLELAAGVGWLLPQGVEDLENPIPAATRISAGLQKIALGGRGLLNSLQLGAEHQWAGTRCAPGTGLGVDDREFQIQSNLDSRLWWVSGRLLCLTAWGRLPGRLQLQLRAGNERAKQAPDSFSAQGRPGGDTRQVEVSLLYLQQAPAWLGNGRFEAEAVSVETRDSQGYSVLLENNAIRTIRRSTLSFAYSRLITGDFAELFGSKAELNLLWQAFRQRSNLEIFRTTGQQASVGVSFSW